MTLWRLIALVAVLLSGDAEVAGTPLDHCRVVAARFANTCEPGQYDEGEDVCGKWRRKLCVTCHRTAAGTMMRLEGNNMPRWCAAKPGALPTPFNITIPFNPSPYPGEGPPFPFSLSSLDQGVCSPPRPFPALPFGTVGVSIDGVLLFHSLHPPSSSADVCLGNVNYGGAYHYTVMSPCTVSYPPPPRTADLAADLLRLYPKREMVLGVALDGRVINGPYNSAGALAQHLDTCNGRMGCGVVSSYSYHSTPHFPFFVGCLGPGSYPSFRPSCAPVPHPYQPPPPCSPPPNILHIIPDDLGFFFDECPPGYPYRTPVESDPSRPSLRNIDKVRKSGVVFERAYTVGPRCAPSRYAFLTGRYPSRGDYAHGMSLTRFGGDPEWDGRVIVDVPSAKLHSTTRIPPKTIATVLARHGYTTIHSGIWHLFPRELDSAYWNDYPLLERDIKTTGFTHVAGAYAASFLPRTMGMQGPVVHNLEWMVNSSLAAIDDARGAPFFLNFAPTAPHGPPFHLDDITQTPAGALPAPPATSMRPRKDLVDIAGGDMWHAAHLWVDDAVGALLQGIEDRGLTENTMVVISMDHGVGARGHLYEAGVRVMLAVSFPPLVPSPRRDATTVVTNTDTTATIMDIVGIPFDGDGLSYRVALQGTPSEESLPKVMEMNMDRAVVHGGYKYISRSRMGMRTPAARGLQGMYPAFDDCEQLYNLQTDGAEQVNLAGVEPEVLARFRSFVACHDMETKVGGTGCDLPWLPTGGIAVGTLATSRTQTGTLVGGPTDTCLPSTAPFPTHPRESPVPDTSRGTSTRNVPTKHRIVNMVILVSIGVVAAAVVALTYRYLTHTSSASIIELQNSPLEVPMQAIP